MRISLLNLKIAAPQFARLFKAAWLPKSHILAIAAGLVAMGGFAAYVIRQNHETALDLWRSELSTSVRYQTWTLRNSLQQSQDDALMLADFSSVRDLLLPGATPPSLRAALPQQVLNRFEEYRTIYEYNALYLLDADGRVAVHSAAAAGDQVSGSEKFKEVFRSVVRTRHFAVGLGPGPQKELSLIFMMPVLPVIAAAPNSLLGVVVIVDPIARDLLPLLTAKRAIKRSSETVLLQLEGGEGRYASPLHLVPRHLAPRPPQSDTLRLAAPSAVETHAMFGQFVDYRGVSVMAAMEKIDSINSVLICKVDSDEALVDFRRVVRIEAVAALFILLAFTGFVVEHNRSAIAREMRQGLARQQLANQVLETKVAQRTSQLAEINQQLHQELGERQKAEEEVRKFNVELDQRVHQRTAELEVANKDLESFSYSVSHDLRAPLRRMRGFSTILLDEHASHLPEEAQKLLRVVNTNAVQMGELIDCLLAFSQLGQQPLRKQKVVPADIVRQAWQELSADWKDRQVEITIGELSVCEADPLLLKQVFINLLSNALKYSRTRDTTKIEIGYTDSGVYYVRDNGVGFDMRFSDKLFGVFKRLHRTADYEGIGIGLAIVERIVNRHGGRIWADALLNQGATFYFTLTSTL